MIREPESDVEREIRESRKFTPQEAVARLAGPGAMKGASPVSPVQQAENEIGTWLGNNLDDPSGALKVVIHRHLKGREQLLNEVDRPLAVIAEFCRQVLASDNLLQELVREADVEWGRAMDERPYFEKSGSPPHPADPYTLESVKSALAVISDRLAAAS